MAGGQPGKRLGVSLFTKNLLLSELTIFRVAVCFVLLFLFGLVSDVLADTVAGTATATVVNRGLTIEAPYTGDAEGDNTLLIEWGLDGGAWTDSVSLSHAASPYIKTIGPLINGTAYQVRITYQDPPAGDIVQLLTGLAPYNPLLHNSLSTGSSKWSVDGGWGIAAGRYGEFSCNTCHLSGSSNIKQVRTVISTPATLKGTLPGDGQAISFLSAVNGSADLGDDGIVRVTSDKICETCHRANKFHNYALADNTSNGHQNKTDCLLCHKHSQGFSTGGCSGCHGGGTSGSEEENFWPDDSNANDENDAGRHAAHIELLAQKVYTVSATALLNDVDSETKQVDLCGYCHVTPGEDADHAASLPADTAFHPLWDKAAADAGAGYSLGNCSNIDCHNNQATGTGTYGWYDAASGSCVMCHSGGGANSATTANPSSGLHNLTAANTISHDGAFGAGNVFNCESCHVKANIAAHLDGAAKSGNYTGVEVGINVATMYTDVGGIAANRGSCIGTASMAGCHSDGGNWQRLWTTEADVDIVASPNPGQPACNVCHGQFGSWNLGTSHAGTYGGAASTRGNTHNRGDITATACKDCHNYLYYEEAVYDYAAKHRNDLITMNDTGIGGTCDVTVDIHGVRCNSCHTNDEDPAAEGTRTYTVSDFALEQKPAAPAPDGTCFGGIVGCHGDAETHWWPSGDTTNPASHPNRTGSHIAHTMTLGTLVAEARAVPGTVPTDADLNGTCRFCHPMVLNGSGVWASKSHKNGVTELYGGYRFSGANADGTIASGDPLIGASWNKYDTNPDDGYLYQLDDPTNPGILYPLDTDAEYRQYLYDYRTNSALDHGTCAQVACHSNTPFTPQWFGDEQAPGKITDLIGYTHNQDAAVHDIYQYDAPGTVHLYWTAPGDNGDFSGLAYEYEVYYKESPIIDGELIGATRAGGAATVLRHGEQQEMVVDGLTPGTPYWFAVVTKDQPRYKDTDHNDTYETFFADGNRSLVGATASSVPAHSDNLAPIFWGVDEAHSHDTGGAVNLSWGSARDHSLPITYLVYWSGYSLKTHLAHGGTLPVLAKPAQYDGGVHSFYYNDATPPTAGTLETHDYRIDVSTTRGIHYQVAGLDTGVLYNFKVRAEDGVGNIDDNGVVSMTMAKRMPQETERTVMAVLSGTNGLAQTDPVSPTWGLTGTIALANNQSVTFTDTADLDGVSARETWVHGISVNLTATNGDRRLAQEFQVQLGYDNGSFMAIGSPVTVDLGRRASRVVKVGLSANQGVVPANANLAVRITSTVPASASTALITFAWGDDAKKGQLMVTAQPINHQPSASVLGPLSRAAGGYIDITWTPSNDGTPSDEGQTLHYDVLGSADNGVTWPYVIGTGLTDADALAGVRWDTVGDGLDRLNGSGIFNAKVRVEASDGYLYETTPGSTVWISHRSTESATIALDNSQDDEPPAAVYISHAEPRPKQGAIYLHWIAVGNDGYNHGTRASYYDIRFRKTADGDLVTNWNAAGTVPVEGEPVPGFSGRAEEFELLNMPPDTSHSVAIVTCDAGEDDIANNTDDNCSGLSNVYTITSGQYGCGICHSTPPDEPDTKGVHQQHGYTLEDCAKCHGDGTGPDDGIGAPGANDVTKYDRRHYDGVINIGWAKDATGDHLLLAKILPTDTSNVTVVQGGITIYNDPDGAGGFNSAGVYSATANTDSGRCMNFIGANATGCHGPFTPQWAPDTVVPNPAEPTCADCHGSKEIVNKLDPLYRGEDPYERIWDDSNEVGVPSEQVLASPPTGSYGGTSTDERYVGAHERHLNASFRFAKGDSCRLCHQDTMELGLHADGIVDVLFDPIADQDAATAATVVEGGSVATTGVTCGSMNNAYCHDGDANWAVPGAKCNSCHGQATKAYNPGDPDTVDKSNYIGHVWDGGIARECTHCHVAGHPQSPDGITSGDPDALLLNNNPAIGINYRSGGVHLRQYSGNPTDVNGAVAYREIYSGGAIDTLAETCWACHEDNGISEWGTNVSVATGNSNYNFGTLNQSAWTGAVWQSGYPVKFAYKKGIIQSTHSTDPTGTSQVEWDAANGRYNETADPIARIRCSNCHDVHDNNLADGDTMTGRPYLRGTWMSNPYEEDGAPFVQDYTAYNKYGAVPRGGTAYGQLGGYYIDQNNVLPGTGSGATPTVDHYPTSGWTVQSSAGLCVLCHGDNIDEMDQKTGENLWLGTNGHANSALGGALAGAANIFDYTHGRPAPIAYALASSATYTAMVPDMGYMRQGEEDKAKGVGYRGVYSTSYTGSYLPPISSLNYAYDDYDWGASVDADSTDLMYHQFSCSKCHNPHASRLPKLMITNCLDIRHNSWDDAKSTAQTKYTHASLSAVDSGKKAAYYASAQNCHRYDASRSTDLLKGGWNKVTPWEIDNLP